MLKQFYPDYYEKSAYLIDYEELFKKGYRGLLFDIDNTLVKHGADASKESIELFRKLKNMGFKICLISNNKLERVERFNKKVKVSYIYRANKPSKKAYINAMEKINTNKENTVFVGDQLFTDVWGAKRVGIRNYLVMPIDKKEEIQIVLKRYLERIVLHFYKKKKGDK